MSAPEIDERFEGTGSDFVSGKPADDCETCAAGDPCECPKAKPEPDAEA